MEMGCSWGINEWKCECVGVKFRQVIGEGSDLLVVGGPGIRADAARFETPELLSLCVVWRMCADFWVNGESRCVCMYMCLCMHVYVCVLVSIYAWIYT